MYLYEGRPGTGKTTLALQFLLDGVRHGERVLYITLSETVEELRLVAKRHGWSLDQVEIFELVPPETTRDPSQDLTVLHPAELELNETIRLVFDRVSAFRASLLFQFGTFEACFVDLPATAGSYITENPPLPYPKPPRRASGA